MPDILSVSQLNEYIAGLIDADDFLRNFWLKGEISGFKYYRQSGHMYFTIKDEKTAVNCVMFKSRVRNLDFMPEDGMEVLLRGYAAVFARQGKYQIYVEEMQPYGVGGLFLYLQQLKERLNTKGYFAPEHKRPIVAADRVGVVTSRDGAAVHDIIRVIHQRNRSAQVVVVHSAVQGKEAPGEIAAGLRLLNRYGRVGVIIVGRGGGSLEDLMAYNSEEVVQAIYESEIPVISAVGHEVDISLADLAADARAATPTQAAQMAVNDCAALETGLNGLSRRLTRAMERVVTYKEQMLDQVLMNSTWQQPLTMVEKRKQILQDLVARMERAVNERVEERTTRLALAAAALDARSPLQTLARGYAIVQREGKIIRDAATINQGEKLDVLLRDYDLKVEVLGKEKTRYGKYEI